MDLLRMKLKEIDRQIEKNVERTNIIRKKLESEGIRFNDWTSPLLQELESIHNLNDELDKEYDNIVEKINTIYRENFNEELQRLRSLYGDKKYRIIDKNTLEEIFINDIEEYLYNFNYIIKLVLENREETKQGRIENPFWWNRAGDYMIINFKNDDTVFDIEKKETYTNEGELISLDIHKVRRNISLSYVKTAGSIQIFNITNLSIPGLEFKNMVNMFSENKNSLEMEIIKKAKEVFAKDKEIMELIEIYE